jgi:hypothetical protein
LHDDHKSASILHSNLAPGRVVLKAKVAAWLPMDPEGPAVIVVSIDAEAEAGAPSTPAIRSVATISRHRLG